MHNSTLLKSLFAYKAWANAELFEVLKTIDEHLYSSVIHAAVRVLNHAFVVDEIFKSQLTHSPHPYNATNTEQTPALAALYAQVKATDAWYIEYVGNITEAACAESVPFTFTDGDKGCMTRSEILLHLISHGGYHRGQAGQIIRSASVAPPADVFTRYLHLAEPTRRLR